MAYALVPTSCAIYVASTVSVSVQHCTYTTLALLRPPLDCKQQLPFSRLYADETTFDYDYCCNEDYQYTCDGVCYSFLAPNGAPAIAVPIAAPVAAPVAFPPSPSPSLLAP